MPSEPFASAQPFDEHNELLVSRIRPPNWKNPTPDGRYHMAVIGAGSAGLVTAVGAAGLGARVALVERSLLGGDCLNSGCVPSKALVRAARAVAAVRDAAQFGVRPTSEAPTVDFGLVMERMRRLRADISTHDSARRLSDLGVDVYLAEGSFIGRDSIRAGDTELRFARACVATGTRARIPAVPGLREAHPLTNETVFSLTELPRRLAIIGAGPIGVELAQSFARFGSEVTLIEAEGGILVREDRDAAKVVQRSMRRDGVRMIFGALVTAVSKEGPESVLRAESKVDGTVTLIRADRILVAAGRVPNVEGLGLEKAGVRCDPRKGVLVDDRLRTSNPHVYAAGDICSKFKFTHVADAMARIVIGNALFFGRSKASALKVPWCIYTDPELAHVGIHKREAEAGNLPIDTYRTEMSQVDRAVLDGETEGFVEIHCKRGTDKILGATIVGRRAGEMISEVTAAMTGGLGLRTISGTIHPYPTRAEAIRKTADAYQRKRLTRTAKRILSALLRLHGR